MQPAVPGFWNTNPDTVSRSKTAIESLPDATT
jgi:hypothetical protein